MFLEGFPIPKIANQLTDIQKRLTKLEVALYKVVTNLNVLEDFLAKRKLVPPEFKLNPSDKVLGIKKEGKPDVKPISE